MNKDELAKIKEFVDPDFLEIARSEIPSGQSQEFYNGFGAGMSLLIKSINQLSGETLLKQQSDILIILCGSFMAAAGEKVVN